MKLSLCMIVKNEEDVLARCLDSVKDCVDEIIIVDTGSTDRTQEIAYRYTDQVYNFTWCDDFSKARNQAFSYAHGEYVMWLDADDVVPTATINYLQALKNNMTADCYMLKYDIAFENGKSTFSYYRERILKNCAKSVWVGAVHECITPFGKVEYLDYSIEHRKIKFGTSNRNLKIYQGLEKVRQLTPREQFYYGRELFDHGKYGKCLTVLKKFIKEKDAWGENIIEAYYVMAKCYWYLEKKEKRIQMLLETFKYDLPRANICCMMGDCFLEDQKYTHAIYWYQKAMECEDVTKKGGFVEKQFYDYYPCLQLCVAYYHLGEINRAFSYNEQAGFIHNSDIVQRNRAFFTAKHGLKPIF